MQKSICSIILFLSITLVSADGQLTYGDKCSVQNAILSVFTSNDASVQEKCDSSKGLICTGTCSCPPTRVWEKGPLFGLFGGGGCIVAANGPCSKGDKCVPNAQCGENIPLCFCEDGYYAHDLMCISSSNQKIISFNSASSINLSLLAFVPLAFAIYF